MTGLKTNERPGTRAQHRYARLSAYKARVVLDLIRDKDVQTADEILKFSERDAAIVIRKLLRSAVANAEHNDEQIADDLYVSACFADEGKTLRRFRPRARGRPMVGQPRCAAGDHPQAARPERGQPGHRQRDRR